MGRIAPALKRAAELFSRRLKDPRQARAAFDRLIPDPAGDGVPLADVLIEAISEQPEAKRALYRSLEPRMKADALLATNTSSLSLETLRAGLSRPGAAGGHPLFNPEDAAGGSGARRRRRRRARRPAPAPSWARSTSAAARQRSARLPGQRRVGALHAGGHAQRGRRPDAGSADAAMVAFGMPMGPLEPGGHGGPDIARAAGEELAGGAAAASLLADRLARGDPVRATGRLSIWRDGSRVKARGSLGGARPDWRGA